MKEPDATSHVKLAIHYNATSTQHMSPSTNQMFLNTAYPAVPCSFPQPSTSSLFSQQMSRPSLHYLAATPPIGPLPPSKHDNEMQGMYSNSGFDMLSVLARLANRPNPQIDLGPVDLSCSFVVADARQYDTPIIYVSPMFERMTLYSASEAIGYNCRFLQAPDGHVTKGSTRPYTDNTSVLHIKQHMAQGKESQASLLNYKKGGQPFVNLVTVIPICWDTDDIVYFVGLQIDMVRQPESILERMRNGTYVANYQTIVVPPVIPTVFPPTIESQDTGDAPLEYYRPDNLAAANGRNNSSIEHYNAMHIEKDNTTPSIYNNTAIKEPPTPVPRPNKRPRSTQGIIDILLTKKAETESLKRQWNQVILENTSGFVHVLSLKGIFLYCSRSTSKLLEYDPSELVGTSISKLCHPSDVIPVMRELKESSNSKVPINLIYRIRRKHSGYIWIECHGRLDLEQGKGRKCIILSGRARPVYQLARRQIAALSKASATSEDANDFDDYQFWGKLSVDGLFLYATSSTTTVMSMKSEELIGSSIFQVIRNEETTDIAEALTRARDGETISVRHHVRNNHKEEFLVDSSFYPGNTSQGEGNPAFILIQVRYAEDGASKSSPFVTSLARTMDTVNQSDATEESESTHEETDNSSESSGDSVVSSVIPSSTLEATPEENLFCELETMRNTSWQFEIHQMRLTNKRLREKIHRLMKRSASS